MAALQNKRDNLSSELETETTRQLEARTAQLAKLDEQAAGKLFWSQAELLRVQTAVAAAKADQAEAEGAAKAARAEVAQHEERKAQLVVESTSLTGEIEAKTQQKSRLEVQNQHLLDQVEPLKIAIRDTTMESEAVKTRLEELQAEAKALDRDTATRRAQLDAEIELLLTKRDELTIHLTQQQQQFDEVATKLGERQRAQDAREENLRMREAKVGQDQRVIARNARLLEL